MKWAYPIRVVLVLAAMLTVGCSETLTRNVPQSGSTGGTAPPQVLETLALTAHFGDVLDGKHIAKTSCVQKVKLSDSREVIEIGKAACPPGGGPAPRDGVALTVLFKARADQPTAGETDYDLIPLADSEVVVGRYAAFNGAQSVLMALCTDDYETNYGSPRGPGTYAGCDLKTAPSGTAGTSRIDGIDLNYGD